MYLCPMNNIKGGHELVDSYSGRVLTRPNVKVIPVIQSVINTVEAKGAKQGFKSLKFKNRHIIPTHPANWIAGVDHDEDKNDDNYEYNDEDQDDNNPVDDFDEKAYYDRVDQDEIDDILADDDKEANPIVTTVDEDENKQNDDDQLIDNK